MKDILLLYPYTHDLFPEVGGIMPSLGLAYLDAFLKSKGIESQVIDCTGQGLVHTELAYIMKREQVRLVGISAMTPFIHRAVELASVIKQIDERIVIIMGGSHASSLGPDLLKQTTSLDIVARGEGELTLLEIVKEFKQEQDPDLSMISGISFKKNGLVITTADRPLIQDLDTVPFPSRDISNSSNYHLPVKWNFREPFAAIVTSRGCKYNCAFCDVHMTFGRLVRCRSVKNIIAEIKYLKREFDVRDIIFYDDTLTINRQRVLELCQAIIEERLRISWGCYSRVDAIDREITVAMKQAGCRMISFGVESGSGQMLKLMRKGITLERSLSAVGLCNKIGIQTSASFVIGFPGETTETILQTKSFVKKLNPLFATFFRFIPYPGTPFYKEYLKQENLDNLEIGQFQELGGARVIKIPGISEENLIKCIKNMYLTFYLNPKKLIQHGLRILRFPRLLGGYIKSIYWACVMKFKV